MNPDTFTAPTPPDRTMPPTTPIESKREMFVLIRRLGSRAGLELVSRLSHTNTATWVDPEHKER